MYTKKGYGFRRVGGRGRKMDKFIEILMRVRRFMCEEVTLTLFDIVVWSYIYIYDEEGRRWHLPLKILFSRRIAKRRWQSREKIEKLLLPLFQASSWGASSVTGNSAVLRYTPVGPWMVKPLELSGFLVPLLVAVKSFGLFMCTIYRRTYICILSRKKNKGRKCSKSCFEK